MKNETVIFEYGKPFDPQSMVTPTDTTEVELENDHPGFGDEEYLRRRRDVFALCRRCRLAGLEPPLIEFTPEETRIWRVVSPKLDELHLQYASDFYLGGKHELAISREEIPQLGVIERAVAQ